MLKPVPTLHLLSSYRLCYTFPIEFSIWAIGNFNHNFSRLLSFL